MAELDAQSASERVDDDVEELRLCSLRRLIDPLAGFHIARIRPRLPQLLFGLGLERSHPLPEPSVCLVVLFESLPELP